MNTKHLSIESAESVFVFVCVCVCVSVLCPQGVCVALDVMRKVYPGTDSLQRTTKFFYNPTLRQSEAGIPIGPNSSSPASSRHMMNLYTTPAPAFQVTHG